MGQYHFTVNLDKRQFIHPHKLGDGLKLVEQCGWTPGGVNDALHLLLAVSNGRGGGDFQSDSELIGSWGGDRIAVVGDYAEDGDLPAEFEASRIYSRCDDVPSDDDDVGKMFTDITDDLIPVLEREYEVVYCGDGWRTRFQLSDLPGYKWSHGIGDRTVEFGGGSYRASEVIAALRWALKRDTDPATLTPEFLRLTPIAV